VADTDEHMFVETDGQVYLVRDRGRWRFPRASEPLPFAVERGPAMDFGSEVVRRAKPKISHHPEDWFSRDDLFSREDVDGLVTKAVYMTMPRLVAEVVFVKGGKVLMEKAARGFSKGHWNLPGGFLDFGERPEDGAVRESEEELGVRVTVDKPLGVYLSGFPGKPTFTLGFVYRGTLRSDAFRLKRDEIDGVSWLSSVDALEGTRNPFAKWAIVDAYREGGLARVRVRRHRPASKANARPVIFLDRDGTINEDRKDGIRTPAQFSFREGVIAGLRTLRDLGYRFAVISNQDAVAWGWISEETLRRIHAKMVRELAKGGVRLENVYYCPHEVEDGCVCRKPRPGMLLAACADLGVSPRDAWMVGDRLDDVRAGKAIGTFTAFLGDAERIDGHGTAVRNERPDLVVDGVAAFARALKSGRPTPPTRPAYT
jgi:D-glycero-D-manno-heptose 1,7-bisphosphate phosphatase